MVDLTGKVAIVTGGSRGIGGAIAKQLAKQGATVMIAYLGNDAAASAVCEDIKVLGSNSGSFKCDVRDLDQCRKAVDTTAEIFGGLDILVNSAGITRPGLLVRMSEEDWGDVLATNLRGPKNFCQAALKPMMKQRSGVIINISSVVGLVGDAGQTNYAAAKAGLLGLTKSLAREVAARNIRVNAVAPGFIETDMTADLPEKFRTDVIGQIAMRRFGSPEDIAAVVAFLASDDASYITGQTFAVDGGMTFT